MQAALTTVPGWFLPLMLSALVTAVMIRVMIPIAHRLGLVDRPGGRKAHARATPSIGGLAMVAGVLATAAWHGSSPAFMAFIAAGVLLLIVGVVDDAIDVPWPWRILAQTAAALIMIYGGGIRVEYVGQVFGSTPLDLGSWSVPFTVLATIGVINAINMFDGLDGLAGSLCLAALGMLTMAAWYSGNGPLVQYVLPILAVVAVFLGFNMRLPWQRRARVFMGNSGSAFLGLTMAWVAFSLTQNAAHPVSPVLAPWLFAAPLVDCVVLTIRRIKLGRSPFQADRDHMHHLLLEAGFTHGQIAIGLTGLSCVLGLLAAVVLRTNAGTEMHLVVGFAGLVVGYYWLTARRARAVRAFRRLHAQIGGITADARPGAVPEQIVVLPLAARAPVASGSKASSAGRTHRLLDSDRVGRWRSERQPGRSRHVHAQDHAEGMTGAVANGTPRAPASEVAQVGD